jgi:hypothetical protein
MTEDGRREGISWAQILAKHGSQSSIDVLVTKNPFSNTSEQ